MTAQYRPYRDDDDEDYDVGSDEAIDREHLTNHWASSSSDPGNRDINDVHDNNHSNSSHHHLHRPIGRGVGSIQIYEKTTEDIPFVITSTRQRFLITTIGIIVSSIFIGFLIGLITSSSSSSKTSKSSYSSESFCSSEFYKQSTSQDVDLDIRDKIMSDISEDEIFEIIHDFSRSARLPSTDEDCRSLEKVIDYFKRHGEFDSIVTKNYSVLLSLPNTTTTPNSIEIIEKSHNDRIVFSTIPTNWSTQSNLSSIKTEFVAYSPSADITGEIVYVNYGHINDYDVLKELDVSVKGHIVLAKQQNLAADEQVRLAQDHGAIGLLLYPDATEGGTSSQSIASSSATSSSIPEDAVRRDSLLWNGLGDPQTPGYPSTPNAYRIPIDDLKELPKIPVQSISLSTALQLLILMGGKRAPDNWSVHSNGSFDYNLGPGFRNNEYRVRVQVHNILKQTTISNVIATIRGSIEPDRYVMIGNHRDSWTAGAIDAAGGTAGLFQLVKVFGRLKRDHGWRPRRSIVFCSWGAEEFNLMGSTEWIEENIKILMARSVAYINMDILAVGNGGVSVAASPLLYQSIYNATKQVDYPDGSGSTIYDTWVSAFPIYRNKSQLILMSSSLNDKNDHKTSDETSWSRASEFPLESSSLLSSFVQAASVRLRPKVRQLDTRSVYAPFFIRAGVPAIEVTFVPSATDRYAASETYPLIHTQYDTIGLLKRFDPKLKYHKSVVQVVGEVVRNLADSPFVPFNLLEYSQVLYGYLLSLESHADLFVSHGLDFSSMRSAIFNFTRSALEFHSLMESIDQRDILAIRRINDRLILLERMFLDPHGLPRNPSKKHVLLSPSEAASAGIIDEMFPGLMDELSLLALLDLSVSGHNGGVDIGGTSWSWDVVRAHYSVIVQTIQSASDFLSNDGLL